MKYTLVWIFFCLNLLGGLFALQWTVVDPKKKESVFTGCNSSAGPFPITKMQYFRYDGFNPFFSPESPYNTEGFYSDDGTFERYMSRFVFYRFEGNGAGVVDLSNNLIAVDTYSKLVFSYARPVKLLRVLGFGIPQQWDALDGFPNLTDGKNYKFFEYDNIGHVEENGTVVLYEWANEKIQKVDFNPRMSGSSPYAAGDAAFKKIKKNGEGFDPPNTAQRNFLFPSDFFYTWFIHATFSMRSVPTYAFYVDTENK